MGIVVDAVSDVYTIPEAEFRPAPENSTPVLAEAIRSLATVNGDMVILLNIDQLLNAGELSPGDNTNDARATGGISEHGHAG